MDIEPYLAPSDEALAEVKALTLREEAKLRAKADPSEVYVEGNMDEQG